MIIDNLLELKDRSELRKWYEENACESSYFWLVVSVKPKDGLILYLDAVEEAICFGWIDGIKKKTVDGRLAQRFTPRRKKSNWTELNKERARRLIRLKKMTPLGEKTLPDLSDALIIDVEIMTRLKENQNIYQEYIKLPELYRRIRIDTIQSVRKDREMYLKRLDKFIEQTSLGKMFGQWNDGGRL